MTESRRGRRPTPEQRAAREADAQARANLKARKQRTRALIEMGGVLAAHGFSSPAQVDELMGALASRDSWRGWLKARGVDLDTKEQRGS